MRLDLLEELADFLEKLPKGRFDYGRWVGANWRGAADLSCGTTACAFGWAATLHPERLSLARYPCGPLCRIAFDYRPAYSQQRFLLKAIEADLVAGDYFEVSGSVAAWLFRPNVLRPRWLTDNAAYALSPGWTSTAVEVAKHIRGVVGELRQLSAEQAAQMAEFVAYNRDRLPHTAKQHARDFTANSGGATHAT